jgi:hypothetical protein
MSIPTEAERLASYHASMAATVAASGKPTGNRNWAPGSGALQTADTARRIHEMAQRKEAQANTLTPAEIIKADAAGRAIARQRAELAGKTLSDTDIQRAGRAGVASAAERAKS